MKSLFPHVLAVSGLCALTAPAGVLINELNINPPGGNDSAFQYAEILTTNDAGQPESQTLGNVSLLFIDSNGGSVGVVEEALDLQGLTTGSNGLLLIGIGYDEGPPTELWTFAPETTVVDFTARAGAGGAGDIGPKGGMTAFLVEDFTGNPGDDLDGTDNGQIGRDDLYGRLLDSVGYGDIPYETGLAVDFSPDNLSRVSGETRQNSTSPWIGGDFLNTAGPASLTFSETFGDFTGTATPGAHNPAPPSQNPIRINEVLVNPPHEDLNVEFLELISTTGGIATTNGLWILIIDSDRDGAVGSQGGTVLEAWNLDGRSTGTNGLLVLGNNYQRSANPWKDIIDKGTSLFDPDSSGNDSGSSSMGDGDIRSNSALSILMVRDFNGTVKSDLVDGSDIDEDDDGVIDHRPWDTSVGDEGILDSVGFDHLNDATGEVWWPTYALGDITQDNLALAEPDSLVRDPAKLEPNQGASWMGGDIGGDSTTGIAYRVGESFGDFTTQISPGQPNPASTPPQEMVVINEVHLDPPGEDLNFEYIEFLSPTRTFTALQDLTLLIVDVEGANTGEIKNVVELRGLSTGGNGLMILGDSYNDPPDVHPHIPAGVHREDSAGLNINELGPNGGLAILLVEGFSGQKNDDLDVDNDGVFDVTFWDSIMDSVAFGAELVEQDFVANFNFVGFNPDSFCRVPGDFRPYNVDAWYGGTLPGDVQTSVVYGETFGPYVGEASPGRFNLAGPRREPSILLNEVHLNPPGDDDNFEYFELISSTGGRQSTNDLSLVVLENAGGNVGEILEVWHLDGMSTGSDGLLLIGNKYTPSLGTEELREGYWDRSLFPDRIPNTPFGDAVNGSVSSVGDPIDLGNNNIGPNDSFTVVLVARYTGEVGQDLDVNNDGVLDVNILPWQKTDSLPDGIIDGVGFLSFDDIIQEFDGKALVAADLSHTYAALQTFQPDNVSRRPGNFTANDPEAWFGGDVAGDQPDGLVFGTDFFGISDEKAATPGAPNGATGGSPDDDTDHDGATDGEEAIAGTDPQDPSDFFHVTTAVRDASGTTLTWTSVTGKSYTVQYSTTLAADSWIDITSLPGDGDSATFTDNDPGRQGAPEGYYRIQVSAP